MNKIILLLCAFALVLPTPSSAGTFYRSGEVLEISRDAAVNHRAVTSRDDAVVVLAAINSAYRNKSDAIAKAQRDMIEVAKGNTTFTASFSRMDTVKWSALSLR